MPRKIRDVRLQTREARQKIAPAKEPYWREIRRGLHVGYYKGPHTATWWLREIRYGRRAKRGVGLADDHVPADGEAVYSFEQVLKIALGEERPTASSGRDYTVEDALHDYWTYREAKSPALSVEIDKYKLTTHVGEVLRARPVAELTTAELEKWRSAMVGARADREQQRRAQSTAERVRRTFFAALNYARRTNPHKVPSDQAWRSVYSFRNIDRPRTRFLSVSEARRLLNAMPVDFRQLARGALYTGLRLGELLVTHRVRRRRRTGARSAFEGGQGAHGTAVARGHGVLRPDHGREAGRYVRLSAGFGRPLAADPRQPIHGSRL